MVLQVRLYYKPKVKPKIQIFCDIEPALPLYKMFLTIFAKIMYTTMAFRQNHTEEHPV